jgi:hypothetical protein
MTSMFLAPVKVGRIKRAGMARGRVDLYRGGDSARLAAGEDALKYYQSGIEN